MSLLEIRKIFNKKGFSELRHIDFEDMGSWPILAKIIACFLIVIAVLSASYFVVIKDKIERIDITRLRENFLKRDFSLKQKKANNLPAYVAQLEDMEDTFQKLLKQLPTQSEVPGLLEDMTLLGVKSGLVFDQISLEPEVEQDFYIESPIKIKAQGGYHQIAEFISGIVGLSRIVTLHDFTIKEGRDGGPLFFEILARTYRYKEVQHSSVNQKTIKGWKR